MATFTLKFFCCDIPLQATFGHPGPGHVPTHCLTHCEEGMHRLAADEARAPLGAKMPGKVCYHILLTGESYEGSFSRDKNPSKDLWELGI